MSTPWPADGPQLIHMVTRIPTLSAYAAEHGLTPLPGWAPGAKAIAVLVLTAEKTKTKRKRLIPISPTLQKLLDRRKLAPDRTELLPTAYVFGNGVGEPVSRRLANRWWNDTCKRAQVTDVYFHDLRHEFGSQLLESGGQLHEVQAALDHANIKMTSTYLNATTQGVKLAFKKLEAKRRRRTLKIAAS